MISPHPRTATSERATRAENILCMSKGSFFRAEKQGLPGPTHLVAIPKVNSEAKRALKSNRLI
jgi:hypothetical protein